MTVSRQYTFVYDSSRMITLSSCLKQNPIDSFMYRRPSFASVLQNAVDNCLRGNERMVGLVYMIMPADLFLAS